MKKIDIHCHTTNRALTDIAHHRADIPTIRGLMSKHEIETTVLLATYFPHRGTGITNFRLLHWIQGFPELVMFGSLDFEHYFFQGMNELTELSHNGYIKGIKVYTGYQHVDQKKLQEVAQLAQRENLPVMFHTGYCYSTLRSGTSNTNIVRASDLIRIAKEYGIHVIASHLNKPFLDDLIRSVKQCPTMQADMSGLLDSAWNATEKTMDTEAVRTYVGECGPARLLFGTDFPVQTHEDSIDFIERAMHDYSESDRRMVYYENAQRILTR